MSTAADVSQQSTFSTTIDVAAVLDRLGIQFLDVHDHRAIVIFDGAILNLECREGDLTALERAEITVYDLPMHSNRETENETAATIGVIDDFVEQLDATAQPP
ncbi:hypothetical protein C477_17725 [Haloterrigena salina JCM 13891]|uniref:Uncharacterized protein n=1 Tax=Haloterrigena salina JCM 13891 TaxID=1227488 RepID=M0BX09_9EURY|nr:hypothetical protein [Haloterrigena salina]ELZ15541.1 hypothetical protein C477_17725 [Haloterrigena salina JCM 13891]